MSNGICDQVFEYNGIGRVLFGVNAQQQAGVEAQKLTEKRNCLIITDSGVARAHLLDGIELSLKQAGFTVSICDEVEPEPTIPGYRRVLEFAESARPDVIVGVGGGSSMDTSKTVARALVNPGPFEQYLGGGLPWARHSCDHNAHHLRDSGRSNTRFCSALARREGQEWLLQYKSNSGNC